MNGFGYQPWSPPSFGSPPQGSGQTSGLDQLALLASMLQQQRPGQLQGLPDPMGEFSYPQRKLFEGESPNPPPRPPDLLSGDGGGQGQQMGQIASLAAAILPLVMALSDRRVKRDLRRIARDLRGFGLYLFRYVDEAAWHLGVIAQEVQRVLPHTVVSRGGLLYVDYGRLYGCSRSEARNRLRRYLRPR